MADKEGSSGGSGIGFCGLLTIVFITLKLTGYINWSWLWVFSPLWVPVVALVVVVALVFLICAVMDRIQKA